jgi:muramoyltetrapeptide carboxypeptidase
MDRKSFFKTFIPAGLAVLLVKDALANPTGNDSLNMPAIPFPSYLKAGDTVAITCPAGPVEFERMQPCHKTLAKWGLNVRYGKTVGKRWQRFGGTDVERLHDFQELLDDPTIKAIIFGKGGYGTMRIIDQLNWDKFRQNPKWLVGYSDLTVVHLHVHANFQIPTIHADMGNGFSAGALDQSASSLNNALFGNVTEYHLKSGPMNRRGVATGKLVGGNLTLVHACAASKSDINTEGKILFLEDVSEYKYNIDRMMMSLKRSGKLEKLAGLVIGQFTATKQDQEESFNLSIEEIVWDKVKEYDYPVCFNFPAGHIAENRALKMGVPFELSVGAEVASLSELEINAHNASAKFNMASRPDTSPSLALNLPDTAIIRR